ncbi:PREDICTED: transcription factor bHLH148-like [Tarenaya hassleriana]|uniref:transcription factor bHLH148-like n=1 Tax=Tarenaya hassleriana TaxID=28532 RepID=UPI00053C8862|nr:PREDICTED: transcription factor bHLH148-like [Tarenaya hassleriana]
MASLVSNHGSERNPNPSFTEPSRKTKKKKPSTTSFRRSTASAAGEGERHARWRSEKQQRIYSAKLIQALRQVRLNSSAATSPEAKRRSKAVREAADRVLAVAAEYNHSYNRFSLPAVQRKARVLGKLVPGCRKQPLPVILEEATDYIQALEMQIRAMSTLAELLSGSAPPPS